MSGSFFDSNTLLYFASGEPFKAERIEKLLADGGTISVQVLNEIASVSQRKFRYSWEQTQAVLAAVKAALHVRPLLVETHELGVQIAERDKIGVYDAMIVAAAILAECDLLWSEDLQDGRVFEGRLTVRNPFRSGVN